MMRAVCDKRFLRSLVLIIIGTLILAVSVPYKFWAVLIGTLALVAGLLLWKVDC